jgi:DNA-binding SARP family transcriptional activator
MTRPIAAAPATLMPRVCVLGTFAITWGHHPVRLPSAAARLSALLALQRLPVSRSEAAMALWRDSGPAAARTNLRSALLQIRRLCSPLIEPSDDSIRLSPLVRVDLDEARDLVGNLATDRWLGDLMRALQLLSQDVLPDWSHEWLGTVQLEHRHERGIALERLSEHLSRRGQHGGAVDAAILAVEANPYRERSWLALIMAHATEGNVGSALQEADRFRQLLRTELGAMASPYFMERVARLGADRQVPRAQRAHQDASSLLPRIPRLGPGRDPTPCSGPSAAPSMR